jgi:hypothetical protein
MDGTGSDNLDCWQLKFKVPVQQQQLIVLSPPVMGVVDPLLCFIVSVTSFA